MQVSVKLAWFERATGDRIFSCSQPLKGWKAGVAAPSVQVVLTVWAPGPEKETVPGVVWVAPSLRSRTYWKLPPPPVYVIVAVNVMTAGHRGVVRFAGLALAEALSSAGGELVGLAAGGRAGRWARLRRRDRRRGRHVDHREGRGAGVADVSREVGRTERDRVVPNVGHRDGPRDIHVVRRVLPCGAVELVLDPGHPALPVEGVDANPARPEQGRVAGVRAVRCRVQPLQRDDGRLVVDS